MQYIHYFRSTLIGGNEPKVEQRWLRDVYTRPLFVASCFFYSAAGVLLILFSHPIMSRFSRMMWWRTQGMLLVIQGGLSFKADVESLAIPGSIWHERDRAFAASLTTFQLSYLVLWYTGEATFPSSVLCFFFLCFCGAIFSKYKSGVALKGNAARMLLRREERAADTAAGAAVTVTDDEDKRQEERFMQSFFFWHTAWHILIPIPAMLSMFMLGWIACCEHGDGDEDPDACAVLSRGPPALAALASAAILWIKIDRRGGRGSSRTDRRRGRR